jgi:hypothetical protein
MPWLAPMVIIGPTAANVTPCISGSRTPNRQKPTACTMVAMPATSRSAMIRCTMSDCSSRPAATIAPPTIRGTATAPAYIASTCCKASGTSRRSGGMSSTGRPFALPSMSVLVNVAMVHPS